MAIHARDLMGFLLLMLVVTEASRKYMTMKDLARMQAEAERLTSMFERSQLASRRLLAPPVARINDLPLLCQSPGMDCLPGEEVRCEMGRHEGCDCEYIRSCFPRASQCTFFNATHYWTYMDCLNMNYNNNMQIDVGCRRSGPTINGNTNYVYGALGPYSNSQVCYFEKKYLEMHF